ncbi:hypothetical protein FHR24_001130 [Wenyingzhuangia heitensis]|uniref:DUF4468 domain-containing protein n=1 Tax=Wenyingzhuangia heitensis TaxID=1487859 RepID=A0ABX0UAU0_9FLAO|nr:hypothetical protein [Wenyingzhuangia heitensis]NIJ44691.1 hypothetical protein [Wenyingzhuangia heitensis]
MKNIPFFILVLFTALSIQSQKKLNQYGYILIPKQFSFQDEPNEHNINKVLKASLEKYNFTSFIKDDDTIENINPCDILHLEIEKSGFMMTKMILIFNDCYGKKIFTSIEGKSRIKEFKASYFEAIGEALKDPNISEHKFTPAKATVNIISKNQPAQKIANAKNNSVVDFILEFKNKKYEFLPTTKNEYKVRFNNTIIGSLKAKENDETYILNTKNIKGTGTFDDFGNFILTRVNPVNKAVIKDIMARTN